MSANISRMRNSGYTSIAKRRWISNTTGIYSIISNEICKGAKMDAKLYLNKAIMQLSRGLEEGGVRA